jgi:hypothetical protein
VWVAREKDEEIIEKSDPIFILFFIRERQLFAVTPQKTPTRT